MELRNKKLISLLAWLIDWWGRLRELWGINYHLPFFLVAYLTGEWWTEKQEKQWKEYESNLLINYDIHNYITDEDCVRWEMIFSHELDCLRCQKRHNSSEKKKMLWTKNFFATCYQKTKKISSKKRSIFLDAMEKNFENKNDCLPSNKYEFNMEWRRINYEKRKSLLEKSRKNFCKKQFKKSLIAGFTFSLILSFTIIFIKYWPNLPWES